MAARHADLTGGVSAGRVILLAQLTRGHQNQSEAKAYGTPIKANTSHCVQPSQQGSMTPKPMNERMGVAQVAPTSCTPGSLRASAPTGRELSS
jgi:hypothetical protein